MHEQLEKLFYVNLKKSVMVPNHELEHSCFRIDTAKMQVYLTED